MDAVRRHAWIAALVVWLLMVNSIWTAMRLHDGDEHRFWVGVAIVACSIVGVGLAWWLHLWGQGRIPHGSLSWAIFACAVSSGVWGFAGVSLGAAPWAAWQAAVAMALGLLAWVVHLRSDPAAAETRLRSAEADLAGEGIPVNHDVKRMLAFGWGLLCAALQIGGIVLMASTEQRLLGAVLLLGGIVLLGMGLMVAVRLHKPGEPW